jgi:hypothetical protein
VSRAQATLSGLLELTILAEKLAGQSGDTQRRSDIRAAAEPLRKFWVEVLGRRKSLALYSKANDFLHDCLILIDPKVTQRLIADLDK